MINSIPFLTFAYPNPTTFRSVDFYYKSETSLNDYYNGSYSFNSHLSPEYQNYPAQESHLASFRSHCPGS